MQKLFFNIAIFSHALEKVRAFGFFCLSKLKRNEKKAGRGEKKNEGAIFKRLSLHLIPAVAAVKVQVIIRPRVLFSSLRMRMLA